VTLALPSVISVAGFAMLGFLPVLPVFVIFQVVRRAVNFAAARPAREVLFTVLSPRRQAQGQELSGYLYLSDRRSDRRLVPIRRWVYWGSDWREAPLRPYRLPGHGWC
jgi:hypothetical protein